MGRARGAAAAGRPVTLSSLLYGILPFGPPYSFRQATERAVHSAADLRWGPDRKGFRRLVHPNGICLTGLWQAFEERLSVLSRPIASHQHATLVLDLRHT